MRGTVETIRKSPVTLIIAALAILGFVFFQPHDIAAFHGFPPVLSVLLYPVKVLFGSLLHAHLPHLLMNLLLWSGAGLYMEREIGSRRLLTVALIATLAGGLLETLLVDPRFIGLSAACYGLIGLVIWQSVSRGKGLSGAVKGAVIVGVVAVLDTAFNALASADQIAYAAHIGGLMSGFLSSLGFGKGGGGGEPNRVFRPMTEADVKPVLDIIYDHDEDDGEDAKAAFESSLADKYVMTYEGRLMGMTGYRADPDTGATAWLSFTYIHQAFRQGGNAYWMMLELREVLEAEGIERLFIATSDYIDEETGEDIYLAAREFYHNKLNAEFQLKVDNFYAPGESKYIYSLPVSDRALAETPPPNDVKARFVGLDAASESETSYVATWEEVALDGSGSELDLPTKSLPDLIDEVSSYDGKALFVTLPDYISVHHSAELRMAGFKELGTLQDYFSKNVGETYWGRYFA